MSYPLTTNLLKTATTNKSADLTPLTFARYEGVLDYQIHVSSKALEAFLKDGAGVKELKDLFNSVGGPSAYKFDKPGDNQIVAAVAAYTGEYFVEPIYEDLRILTSPEAPRKMAVRRKRK